jgi:hypothetical protein
MSDGSVQLSQQQLQQQLQQQQELQPTLSMEPESLIAVKGGCTPQPLPQRDAFGGTCGGGQALSSEQHDIGVVDDGFHFLMNRLSIDSG